jgi:virulence-associated protein VapD
MYAISFDLTVADTAKAHPVSVAQAYADIGRILAQFHFERVQGSLYLTRNEDMAALFQAIMTLKSLSWFPQAVRDIRAFRVEQWSDFTSIIKPSGKERA